MKLKVLPPYLAAFIAAACFFSSVSAVEAAAPAIVITNLPAYGAHGNLGGLILNANPATNCVVVFIYVAGDWYSKPSCAAQLTPIQADGSWSANISPNANDVKATEVAAFLVPTNYNLGCVDGTPGLTIPAQAEAVVYADRVNPATRQFNYSDYNWSVKTSSGGLAGPGPNYFNDSTNNVWVDAQGLLHLKITHTNNTWQCVEIISARTFGYGQYRFTVSADVNGLDPSVVLGMFTWSDDTAYNDREIDLELSRWNYAFGPTNVENFAVSPYNVSQVTRFSMPTGVVNTTHSFIWQPTDIGFKALNGGFSAMPVTTNILKSWSCTSGIPPAGGEQVHINLWLNQGNAPVNGQPTEVVLSRFEFVPLGPAPSAQLYKLTTTPGGTDQLNISGVPEWHYQIQASSNLFTWSPLGNILATNSTFQFTNTNTPAARALFYRTLTDP